MRKLRLFALVLLLALVSSGAYAQHKQSGKATYYANSLHGRKTSSGEIYNKDSLTCAHRTLPFGTMLRVRDVNTGKEVVVEVTDRGPFSSAIVDLSLAAAKQLDMCRRGVIRVEICEITEDELLAAEEDEEPVLDYEKTPYPQLMVLSADGESYVPMWQWAEEEKQSYDDELIAAQDEESATDVNKVVLPGRWQSLGKLSASSK